MKLGKLVIVILIALYAISCSDIGFGNHALSNPPETSGATLDTLFNSVTDADKVLVTAYSYLPYGIVYGGDNKMGGNVLESLTDLQHSFRSNVNDGPYNLYYTGSLSSSIGNSAGNENYRFGSEKDYYAIRYAWIFIENAARIPDVTEAKRNEMIAQAKMIIAISYFNLLHYCGGVPILEGSVGVNDEMKFERATFARTVDFIVRMLDEAAPYLNWNNDEITSGRMTKAGALAMKLRVLCFAASDTFNSSTPFHPEANEYHCYGNYDKGRWDAAKQAALDFMKEYEANGYYDLVMPEESTHMGRRLAYRKGYYERGTVESLISVRKGYNAETLHNPYFANRYYSGPTLNWVNMYAWDDGSDFPENFDWSNPSRAPFFEPDGTPTRDPRLYENIAVPGDLYFNGSMAPLHTNHPDYRAGGTGFSAMKFILREAADRNGRAPHWPYMRFAEVLLNAAEAINEADGAPSADAYSYVNRVRNRVGLSDLPSGLDKIGFRKALLKERAMEFGYEEIRWFDMVRWGLEEDFRKPLYGLFSKGLDDKNNPTKFEFSTYPLSSRAWQTNWDTKWYLSPIPRTEVDKNYGMTQNPGW